MGGGELDGLVLLVDHHTRSSKNIFRIHCFQSLEVPWISNKFNKIERFKDPCLVFLAKLFHGPVSAFTYVDQNCAVRIVFQFPRDIHFREQSICSKSRLQICALWYRRPADIGISIYLYQYAGTLLTSYICTMLTSFRYVLIKRMRSARRRQGYEPGSPKKKPGPQLSPLTHQRCAFIHNGAHVDSIYTDTWYTDDHTRRGVPVLYDRTSSKPEHTILQQPPPSPMYIYLFCISISTTILYGHPSLNIYIYCMYVRFLLTHHSPYEPERTPSTVNIHMNPRDHPTRWTYVTRKLFCLLLIDKTRVKNTWSEERTPPIDDHMLGNLIWTRAGEHMYEPKRGHPQSVNIWHTWGQEKRSIEHSLGCGELFTYAHCTVQYKYYIYIYINICTYKYMYIRIHNEYVYYIIQYPK